MTATTTTVENPAVRHLTKRQARNEFRVAKWSEQEMYPRADAHYREHGHWPADYLAAKAATVRAFEVHVDAKVCSGITILATSTAQGGLT
jgi:hypothetical protein